VKLQGFYKFSDTTDALAGATAAVEGKLAKSLKKFLQTNIVDKAVKDELAVSDPKIGKAITEKLGVQCVADSKVNELMRGIRSQIDNLITGPFFVSGVCVCGFFLRCCGAPF
jgi:nucleolar protein 58